MMTNELLDNLNEQQKEAVLNNSRFCIVKANVGSGKTTVLTTKVAYLLEFCKIELSEIVVLTFTNKAANEIKERIKKTTPELENLDNMFFGTFHGIAMKLLKEMLPLNEIDYSETFVVMDPDEEMELASQLIADNNLNIKYQNKLSIRLDKYYLGKKLYANMKTQDDIDKLVDLLIAEKKKENVMTFYDLIFNATLLLKNSKFKPKWIIVDEFQDCDEEQLKFIDALTGEETKIFVVGDPNQIIYTWRGSSSEIFKVFKQEHDATEISLPINYRSSSSILDVAKIFLNDSNDLKGVRECGDKIVVKNHYNSFQEAQYLADQIKELTKTPTFQYRDIAVLYRLQKQSSMIEDIFIKEDIPYEVSLRKTVKDIPVLGWLIKLLKFAINNNDITSMSGALCDAQFGYHFKKEKCKITNNECVENELYKKCINFSEAINQNPDIDIYNYFDIGKYLSPTSSTYEENMRLVTLFIEQILVFGKENNLVGIKLISSFTNSVVLQGLNITNDKINLSSNSVKLMTLHAAKGMEFKYVYIIGVNKGLIPLLVKNENEYEEEMRLFFVGITRAKDKLELSYYTNTDANVFPGASNYIDMIPKNLLSNDSVNNCEVNLTELKNQIREAKNKTDESNIEKFNEEVRYKHPKYGIGILRNEDEQTITIEFSAYGNKTFMKAFNEIQKI